MTNHYLQPSFIGGEVSPSLQARVDAAGYNTWLHTAKNMLIHPQGGVSNRPGTQYMANAKQNAACRLIPFLVGTDEAYVIEAGANYFRFHTPGGPLLNGQGNIYEIQTPYSQQALAGLHYTQHQYTLYVAHPQYPLYQLVRTERGQFVFQAVDLKGGPFQPFNTDSSKKMRVYPQTETLESEGVDASLMLEPVSYSEWMVWAYFDGTRFYTSDGFGLNVQAVVNAFNTAYNAQGLTAYNLGGIIKVESSAADGGDWNGKVFSIEYHHGFIDPPVATFSQALSGGENAGTQTVTSPGHYVLESNVDFFTPLHVGGHFCVVHCVEGQLKSGSLGYESTSQIVLSGGDWSLRTGGTWTGQLVVETSRDLGTTWQTLKILSRADGDDNFYLSGNLNDAQQMYQIRVRSCQITGSAEYELGAESFIQRGIVEVENYVSATQAVVVCEQAFGSQDWTDQWAEGSFSPAAGYPACVFCYRDRLGLAASDAEPQTLWFSKTGNFTDFGRARDTLLDTDALSVRLSGNQLNAVQAVVVSNRLLIFTSTSEWSLGCNGAFTLDNLQLEQQSQRGAYPTAPVMIGGRVLFVQARGSVLRDFYYDYSQAAYTGEEVTWRAKHLLEGRTITQMAFQQEPDSLLWCLLNDGTLLSLTYMPEQGIWAWTHHQTQGTLCSICTLAQEGKDQLWCVVARNGKYLIERFCFRPESADPASPVFLDSSVTAVFAQAQQEVSGLSHLEGKTVTVLADGNVINGLQVSEGKITLPLAASYVHVGLNYEAELVTLPVPAGAESNFRKRRLVSLRIQVLRSRGGYIGTEDGDFTQLCQRTNEAYNTAVQLKTQTEHISLVCAHQTAPRLIIRQQDPLPLTVLSVGVQWT